MKKFAVLLFAITIMVVSANAASSNTLTVNGTVSNRLEVGLPTLGDTTGTISMILNGSGNRADTGNITLRVWSNKKNWTITFASQNASPDKGKLKATDLPSIDYVISVVAPTSNVPAGASIGHLTDTPLTTDQTIVATGAKTPAQGLDFTLKASVLAQTGTTELWEASDTAYSDTIVISIAVN